MTNYSFAAKHLLEIKQNKEAAPEHIIEVLRELHTSDHPHLGPFHDYLRTTELPVHDTKDLLHSLSLSQAIPILTLKESFFTVPGTSQLAITSKLEQAFIDHFYTSPVFHELLAALK